MKKNIIVIIFIAFITFITVIKVNAAVQYQKCSKGPACTVGEFLYDDDYVPIATGSCTLTSRDPAGTVILNSVAMTPQTDGWYEYAVPTSDKTEGLYRTQMCCTVATDYLCLDRSFTITLADLSTTDVAGAVWNAKTASHSGTGTFGNNLQNPSLTAASIWTYADRSLTSYGNLISDIWAAATRTLSGTSLSSGGDLATKSNVESTTSTTIQTINTVNTNNNKNVTDKLTFGKNSVIFEVTVTNPSSSLTQAVPFTYYLPSEVKKEGIIQIDPLLVVNSSLSNPALSITGEVSLAPSQSKPYTVEVFDVWTIPSTEIESVRSQAESLSKPLIKTAYFGQGSTIKSDIFASLDSIVSGLSHANSPEERIEAYRKGMILLVAAKNKLNDLKTLVASAGSIGTIFGFVGGIQAFSVWGLVVVLIAGFVFLALYMKNLKNEEIHESIKKSSTSHLISYHPLGNNQMKFLVFGFIIGGGILFGLLSGSKTSGPSSKKNTNTELAVQLSLISPTIVSTNLIFSPVASPTAALGEKKIIITEDSLNVREEAGSTAKKIAVVKKGQEYIEKGREQDLDGEPWIHIQVDANKTGWVLAKYTTGADTETVLGVTAIPLKGADSVVVTVPEGETVVVRDMAALSGKKVMTLNTDFKTEKLGEKNGWVQITQGWVPAIYITESIK